MLALQPVTLLLLAGWRDFFGISAEVWNVGLTVASGLLMYAVLRADLTRLGLGLLLNAQRYSFLLAVYALVGGASAQIPRVVLEIEFSMRRDYPLGLILERISNGIAAGGAMVLTISAIVASLAYLNAIRIAATGEGNAGKWGVIDGLLSALIVTGAYTAASLSTFLYALSLCAIIGVIYAGAACDRDGRRRPIGAGGITILTADG
jgi:hypothetical protein